MTLRQFLIYLTYTESKPERVNTNERWKAMLKWYNKREELKEPFIYPYGD